MTKPRIGDIAHVEAELVIARHLFRVWVADSKEWTVDEINEHKPESAYGMVLDVTEKLELVLYAVRRVVDTAVWR